ncbi:MBL fold metallo-hydrolase RNA specificity domain-containing protein [Aneurinibacillus migulanus]|uniref:MBL fold metallo-hydrolase RNA specificity domain-containing protein n=1 Tax=Aneurinibacillus migulanus TaxID=47500 RepID=UPI0020A020B1|nr:MBL fold metallo-hydrolase [Aneurinibacillus migulanus]
MKIQFIGGARTVTGSCYVLDTGRHQILIDCGMFQGNKELDQWNEQDFPFDPVKIAAVVLTHAHIDHSGLIPKLCKQGFAGSIIATHSTAELCSIMLPDSGHIQEAEAEWYNRKRRRRGRPEIKPLYTEEDARRCLSHFKGIPYDEYTEVVPGITIRMRDAGHILGSAIVEMWVKESEESGTCKLVFSGDLGSKRQAIVKDPAFIDEADYVFIESTYGDRLHGERVDRSEILGGIVRTIQEQGGNIIIPSFSVGRTQEIIYELSELLHKGKIAPLPVFVDSPLAIEATRIFRRNQEVFDEESQQYLRQGVDPLSFPGLQFVESVEESQRLNRVVSGTIIISSSGMCEAGRIKHHLKHHLWRPKSHIVFVGYQAQGTLGRRIVDGAKRVRIFGEDIKVSAQIHNIEGFSAHADQAGLLEWLAGFVRQPKKVFIVHGEEDVSLHFAKIVNETLGLDAHVPYRFETVTYGEAIEVTAHVLAEKEQSELPSGLAHALENVKLASLEVQNILQSQALSSAQKQEVLERLAACVEALEQMAQDCEV